jgi:hypothetical protein
MSFKIGSPQLILDMYDWLPSEGESKVSFRSIGLDVILDVEYERDISSLGKLNATLLCKREILFKYARYFIKNPFPGVMFFEYSKNSGKPTVGGLTEFFESEFAKNGTDVYQSMMGGAAPKMRHFSIQFLSANVGFHVLAQDVLLSDELLVN